MLENGKSVDPEYSKRIFVCWKELVFRMILKNFREWGKNCEETVSITSRMSKHSSYRIELKENSSLSWNNHAKN